MKMPLILLSVALLLVLGGTLIYIATDRASTSYGLISGETVSWEYKGAYDGHPELIAQAREEIVRLTALLEEKPEAEYDLRVSIAQQHDLIGEGRAAHSMLSGAIALAPERSLAYGNMGVLFARMGAKESAKRMFEEALARDDTVQHRILLVSHLEQYFFENQELVREAHEAAIEAHPESELLKSRFLSWKQLTGYE